MADDDEKKIKKQRWTLDELEILYTYAQKLEPDEKINYAEITENLVANGYDRVDIQVQKKFERMRWEAKNNSTSMLRRLGELIEGLKEKTENGTRVKSNPTTPKAATPKASTTPKSDVEGKDIRKWTLTENYVLLDCLLEGNDKPAYIHSQLPQMGREKIQNKLKNVSVEAKNRGATMIDIVRRQIARLEESEKQNETYEESDSEEEEQLVTRGTKRKLEDSSDDRSTKRQRVMESPRLNGVKSHDAGSTKDDGDLKKILDQISNNNRVNFANLRTYIRDKFEESRKENDELRSQVTLLEDKLDILTQEVRAWKANGTGLPNKTVTPAKALKNGDSTPKPSPEKQQISYYNFL